MGRRRPCAATLKRFLDDLGDHETARLRAVSIDMSGGDHKALREDAPHAMVCFGPFHVVALANRALNEIRRTPWNQVRKCHAGADG